MSSLGKAHGIFSLKDSDNFIGSFIRIDDLCEIFNVSIDDLSAINFVDINGILYADEHLAQIAWYKGKVKNAPAVWINGAKCSFDELVLKKIINDTYDEALIEHQVKWGKEK